MQCKACGHWIPQQDQYCGKCGTKKPSQSANGGAWFNQADNLGGEQKKTAPIAVQPKEPAVFPTAPQVNKPRAYGYQKPQPVVNSGWHWGWIVLIILFVGVVVVFYLAQWSWMYPPHWYDDDDNIADYIPTEMKYIQVDGETIWLKVDHVDLHSEEEGLISYEGYYEIFMSGEGYSVKRYLILSLNKNLLLEWELDDYEEYAPVKIEKEE